ncbi:MAG: NAD(P)-dependent oxidoreductase [Burkholderiaceae bacterium]|nr:NAD(P)-dependent oxidoreductase [Burkholderiaceae bacterium]
MNTAITFIGLGAMGTPMLAHLLRQGCSASVYARSAASRAAAEKLGARLCDSPAAAAQNAAFVFTNVTSTDDVRAVLCGPDGVMHGARPGTICIDHSTIAAEGARQIAQTLEAAGLHFLDAPVSGGVNGAKQASLSIMVGGAAAVFDRALPLLRALGQNVRHVGPSGSGQVAKACNQLIQVVTIEAIAEAMLYASRQGVDAHAVLGAISTGFAGSRMLDLMGPKMAERDFSAGIEARLHAKDFGLIANSAQAVGLHLPALEQVQRQLKALMQSGWGQDDTSSLLRVLEAQQD